jgi:polysaccharide deacetylase 2 family uncharacterized protein YibQ
MRSINRRLSQLETVARQVAQGPRRIIMVDELDDAENVEQRLADARRDAGTNGLVVHVRRCHKRRFPL